MSDVEKVASWLRGARAVTVITGAGISAESGVPTFRGADGLWRSFRPEDLATPQAFARDPQLIWDWYRWRRGRIGDALPNKGHQVLARPFFAFSSGLPVCAACGALLRPDVVWFGEALDGAAVNRALTAVHACEVLILVGTSGIVYPVAGFPLLARRRGARVVEINIEPTPLSEVADVVLTGPSGVVLPEIEAAL
jgi:NAD-dependent deacetylase